MFKYCSSTGAGGIQTKRYLGATLHLNTSLDSFAAKRTYDKLVTARLHCTANTHLGLPKETKVRDTPAVSFLAMCCSSQARMPTKAVALIWIMRTKETMPATAVDVSIASTTQSEIARSVEKPCMKVNCPKPRSSCVRIPLRR
jgi:hypothetical protein